MKEHCEKIAVDNFDKFYFFTLTRLKNHKSLKFKTEVIVQFLSRLGETRARMTLFFSAFKQIEQNWKLRQTTRNLSTYNFERRMHFSKKNIHVLWKYVKKGAEAMLKTLKGKATRTARLGLTPNCDTNNESL